MPNGKHLTLEDREIIEKGIVNGSDKAAIAKTLGKDKSTISLEIKKHREVHASTLNIKLQCANYRTCRFGRKCEKGCPDYVEFKCPRRDRSPGACNGCEKTRSCHFVKYFYNAKTADHVYRKDLVESREGINLDKNDVGGIAKTIVPLIKQGQSVYVILRNHPEIKLTEKTLYTYIEGGVFREYGLTAIDLRRQVSRRLPKKAVKSYKKRQDRRYLLHRKHEDYVLFMAQHPDAVEIQMDTVYNDVSNGPFIQTFKIIQAGFMICLLHKSKTAEEMVKGVDTLERLLLPLKGKTIVIKTDRGSEFVYADSIEMRPDGSRRFFLFYCDPMASYQKGSLENNHEEIRYVLPKECSFLKTGLTSQEAMNKVTSSINSFPKQRLGGKTPFQLLQFFYPGLLKTIKAFGISKIPQDEVNLTPSLLKSFKI